MQGTSFKKRPASPSKRLHFLDSLQSIFQSSSHNQSFNSNDSFGSNSVIPLVHEKSPSPFHEPDTVLPGLSGSRYFTTSFSDPGHNGKMNK